MNRLGEPLTIHPLSRSVAQDLANQLPYNSSERTVIAIGGESASGKSTTALALQHVLAERGIHTELIHLDGYFYLPPRENHQHRIRSLAHVGLQEVNMDLLQQHLDSFRAGALELEIPVVDYQGNQIERERRSMTGKSMLIVEGTYALFLQRFDIGVFMERTFEESQVTRMNRTRESYDPFVERVLALEQPLVKASHHRAHFRVSPSFELIERQL